MNSWRTIYKIIPVTELDYQTSQAEDGLTAINLSGSVVGDHWAVEQMAEFYHREVTNYIACPETILYFSEVYILKTSESMDMHLFPIKMPLYLTIVYVR